MESTLFLTVFFVGIPVLCHYKVVSRPAAYVYSTIPAGVFVYVATSDVMYGPIGPTILFVTGAFVTSMIIGFIMDFLGWSIRSKQRGAGRLKE